MRSATVDGLIMFTACQLHTACLSCDHVLGLGDLLPFLTRSSGLLRVIPFNPKLPSRRYPLYFWRDILAMLNSYVYPINYITYAMFSRTFSPYLSTPVEGPPVLKVGQIV